MKLTLESATLLFHMQKNRPHGLRREDAIAVLQAGETDPLIEPIRKELLEYLSAIGDNEYLDACLNAIKNHIMPGEEPPQ